MFDTQSGEKVSHGIFETGKVETKFRDLLSDLVSNDRLNFNFSPFNEINISHNDNLLLNPSINQCQKVTCEEMPMKLDKIIQVEEDSNSDKVNNISANW